MSTDSWVVRFVDDLSLAAEGMCLYWIKEIHIDKQHEGKPWVEDIIRHERKHYYFIDKALHGHPWVSTFWIILNNIWDFFDVLRICIKYPSFSPAGLLRYGIYFAVFLALIYILAVELI